MRHLKLQKLGLSVTAQHNTEDSQRIASKWLALSFFLCRVVLYQSKYYIDIDKLHLNCKGLMIRVYHLLGRDHNKK